MSISKSIEAIVHRREVLKQIISRMATGSVAEGELDSAITEIERAATDLYRIALHELNVATSAASLEKLIWPLYDEIRFAPEYNPPHRLRRLLESIALLKETPENLQGIARAELARMQRTSVLDNTQEPKQDDKK